MITQEKISDRPVADDPKKPDVAIVDDDAEERIVKPMIARDAKYSTYIVTGRYNNIDDLVNEVITHAKFVVCDNSLQPKGMASFWGAEVVAELYQRNIPGVLVTQYVDSDVPAIRRYRRYIPIVLSNKDFNADSLRSALEICAAEIQGHIRADREAGRTIIRVERVKDGFVDVIVPSWNPRHAIRIMKDFVPDDLQEELKEGKHLFAKVNTSAKEPDDLYFYDFEAAPEPPEDFLE